MRRTIIHIDESKCNGCGACAAACHEGALVIIDGKAKLMREDYCDGLGDCLPVCPTGAITVTEREAKAYDEQAVLQAKAQQEKRQKPCGCIGMQAKLLQGSNCKRKETYEPVRSELQQWPCQIKLMPVNAPYFDNAELLIAADCTAYAFGNFHREFMRNHITMIGCPKLDAGDDTEKLTQILSNHKIRSVTIVRMEVPCCGGLEQMVKRALQNSGVSIPCQVVTITTNGKILD